MIAIEAANTASISMSAQYVLFIEPFSEFSLDLSILISLTAMIGGLGTAAGPILGAFLLTPLQELLRAWLGGQQQGLHLFIYGSVLVVVVILLPNGVITWLARKLDPLLRRLPALTRGEDGVLPDA